MIGLSNFNIGLLLRAITEVELDFASVGRLYSLSGMHLNHFALLPF